MAYSLNNNGTIGAPKAWDDRTGKFSGGAWIPFATTAEAIAAVPSNRRYVGLTCLVGSPTVWDEYWYAGGIADGNLVLKTTAATKLTGTIDGDRLPAMSTTKKGAVPATGTPTGTKYLRDDGSFETPSGVVGSVAWGAITGDLADQLDLNTRLNYSPKVFNVTEYGVVGDERFVHDAVINGTTTITSATANFVSGDVGKKILVNEQLLTVTARNSSTSITVNTAVSASGSAKTIYIGTDRASQAQDAYNAAAAWGGGIVYWPRQANAVTIAGALQTSDNEGRAINCQIYIPSVTVPYQGGTDRPKYVRTVCEVPPSQVESGFIDVGTREYIPIVHSLLPKSAATGTRPAVFGIGGYSDVYGSFTFTELTFENMWIRTHHHATDGSYMTACDFSNSTNVVFDSNRADIDVSAYNSVAPSTVNFGFMGPRSNGGTVNVYKNNLVVGYHEGYSAGEHSLFIGGQAMGCDHAIDFQKAGHMSRVYGFTVHWCKRGFGFNAWDNGYATDSHIVNLRDITIERTALGKWYDAVYDVDDSTDGLRGNFIAASTTSGVGFTTTIVKNGGANLRYRYAADAEDGGGGSGSVGPTDTAFDQDVLFDGNRITNHTVAGAIVFAPDASGRIKGGKHKYVLVADGTNTPTFDAALQVTVPSETYATAAGSINIITFEWNGTNYTYTIVKAGTYSAPGVFPVSYGFEADTVGVTPTDWSATSNMLATDNGVIAGSQELRIFGGTLFNIGLAASGVVTPLSFVVENRVICWSGLSTLELVGPIQRANATSAGSVTSFFTAVLRPSSQTVELLYFANIASPPTVIATVNVAADPIVATTVIYDMYYKISAAHLHTVRVSRSSDGKYLSDVGGVGTWVSGSTDLFSVTDTSITSPGSAGLVSVHSNASPVVYADTVSLHV